MSATKPKLPHDVPRTIDLRLTPNVFQASAIVLLSVVGAIVGYHAVDAGKWLAAAGGGIVGMVAAAFISGLILMFTPPQAVPPITVDAWIAKYRRWRRRFTFTTGLCIGWIAVAFTWHYLRLPTSAVLIACWSVLMFVLYAVPHYYVRALRLCRCPSCDELFGFRGALAWYPHCCRNCDFTVARECEVAK